MNRAHGLLIYCLIVGLLGWLWLLASGPIAMPFPPLALFVGLALAIEATRLRVSPQDPHSMVGIVLLTASFVFGPPEGALVAAVSGLIFGIIQPLVHNRPPNLYLSLGRPFLRSGVRAAAILAGPMLATATTGDPPDRVTVLLLSVICYPLVIQLNRVAREYVQGGRAGVETWWRGSWRSVIGSELVPLPTAWLAVEIYQQLAIGYFLIGAALLFLASITVRQASLSLQQQRRSVRELALLNQVSRAIIRSGLDVSALCDLIYTETSKLVDTSSFHLGLFHPGSDQYTLMVRVQDRVHLPPLTVELPAGDGIIGWMRDTGRAVLVHDFLREMDTLPARPRYQSARPPRSGIYVPLIVEESVIGSISIQSYLPNAFDASDLRMLSLIADQAAAAIAKARTFDEARLRAVQLQAIHEVSQRITAILDLDALLLSVVQLIRERFGYHPVHMFTLEENDTLVFRASTAEGAQLARLRSESTPLGVGLVGAAAAAGQSLLANDVASDVRYVSDNPETRAELAVPLRFADQSIGVLDLQSAEPNRFNDADLFVMQTLAGQIAVAIESARAYTAQREEAWTLNALLQVAENTAWAESLDQLLPAIVRLPPLLLGCDRCYCLQYVAGSTTVAGGEPQFKALAAYGLTTDQRTQMVGSLVPEHAAPLLAQAVHRQEHVAIAAAQSQPDLVPAIQRFGGGALLVLPLTARGATLGVLVADYDGPDYRFTSRALTLYTGIASQVAGALESALLAQSAEEAERIEQELRVARDIQTALLPARPPVLPGWDLAADWRSARLVGGDFYDFWWLAGGAGVRSQEPGDRETGRPGDGRAAGWAVVGARQLGFVIADVSDKGVPAAMFMTLSRSLVRAAALDGSSPSTAVERANRWITRDSESGMFVTLFYGILDPETGRLRFACAGHNPPLLVRAGEGAATELTTPGIALGVLEDAVIGEAEVTLSHGDMLVCYTDGITEAINNDEEPFGVPRLVDVAVGHRQHSAADVLDAITAALSAFTGDRQPFDDLTMVVVKRLLRGG